MTAMNDDVISHANTEDSLLSGSSRHSSDIIISNQKRGKCCNFEKTNRKSAFYCLCLGIIFLTIGIFTSIWTPFELLMKERLNMRPGLPPFNWWQVPPDEVLLKAYLFNVTNAEEFLNDPSIKLNFQEIGPIIYREKLIHSNITFNDNSTLTYVATRQAIFLPDMNTVDLNATIIVPNWPLLGIASYLYNENFLVKMGFNVLTRSLKSEPFVKMKINDVLWNNTDPILQACQTIAPHLVPIDNMGVLSRVYDNFVNTVNVFIGAKYGDRQFFLIDKYDGSEYLPNYGPQRCANKVTNGSEGVTYPQYLTKDTEILYWRNTFCKNAPLHYHDETIRYGVKAYRYVLLNSTFDRTEPEELDCFKSHPRLPSGLSDVSRCHFDFPLAASFPHFLYGDSSLRTIVTGLMPNVDRHGSYLIVEPLTGVPINSKARSQCNLVVRKLYGFTDNVQKFSGLVLPMFWLEYGQVGLPWHISAFLYFHVNLLPILQIIFTIVIIFIGLLLIYVFFRIEKKQRHLRKNKTLHFEQETFINNKTELKL